MATRSSKERLAAAAERQHGRVSRAQLEALGYGNGTVAGWIENGYLRRVLPKVYAVGHAAPSHEAGLAAAVLYAGPGAVLSHVSAAHHRGLIKYSPDQIHVSTPLQVRSLPGFVIVHPRRDFVRAEHNGIPTTNLPQTLLDLAATTDGKLVARALAALDFRKELDVHQIERACGKGRRGARHYARRLKLTSPDWRTPTASLRSGSSNTASPGKSRCHNSTSASTATSSTRTGLISGSSSSSTGTPTTQAGLSCTETISGT